MMLFDFGLGASIHSPSLTGERETTMHDLTVTGFGMFSLIVPVTDRAKWALHALIETQPCQWAGQNLIVGNDCLGNVMAALAPHLVIKSKGGSGYYQAAPAYHGG